jgi:phosphatidylserine/phosphatidylglycerophosphate/cardiolipin synthase-like enzyme
MESPAVRQWLATMHRSIRQNVKDDPNYYAADPESLITTAEVQDFIVGTGDDIYEHISTAISNAEFEVILVTCYWAHSKSLKLIGQALRIRIELSSLSLWQKLFQTSSLLGRYYRPEEWEKKLGLPPASELRGLDIIIKSIFVRPISVMHPKFVIIDRRQVWLPSCNVSWENWFEGCVVFTGPVVQQFVVFWQKFCGRDEEASANSNGYAAHGDSLESTLPEDIFSRVYDSLSRKPEELLNSSSTYQTIFLPSPHHRNPRFHFFPWAPPAPVPTTPLNVFLLTLFETAKRTVYIHTPNLTSLPVLSAILTALERGVHVSILTSKDLMALEQLVTAGTTTARCVKWLIRRYKKLCAPAKMGLPDTERTAQSIPVGSLEIKYFRPPSEVAEKDAVQSHIKLTIVDGKWVVLGSGNMERASWYTSQELGVAVRDSEFATLIAEMVRGQMRTRTTPVFSSDSDGLSSQT